MKKFFATLLSLVMALSLVACGGSDAAEETPPADDAAVEEGGELPEIELLCAHGYPSSGDEHAAMLKAAEMLSERTGGKLTMTVHGDGTLGSEMEVCAQIIAGAIDIGFSEGCAWADATGIAEMNVFGLPYLYESFSALKQAGLEIVPDAASKVLEEGGANLVAFQPLSGALRSCLTTETPIRSPEDFAGLKLRCPEIKLFSDTVSALGANPTPIAFTEVYTAMSQGIVDGMELDAVTTRDNNLQEVIKYFTNTYHLGSLNIMCMNKDTWNSLPAEYQEIYKEVMYECIAEQYDIREASMAGAVEDIAAAGVEIIDFTPEQMAQLASQMEPIWNEYREMGLGDIIDQLEACE